MKHNHHQIECPNCGSSFELDKNKFASILSQVKENEIDKQVSEKVKIFKDKIDSESQLAINNAKSENKESVEKLEKALEIEKLKNQEQLKSQSTEIDLAVAQSKNVYEKEINKINSDKKETIEKLEKALEIEKLKNQEQLKNQSTQIELEIERKKNIFEKDRDQKIEKINSQYKQEINLHKEEIARLKDFQSKLSTKMIGETLEQHCQMVFDLRQADGCFPNAQLLKDNDVVNGTKGDFIFKDYDEDGNEIISVMLEMKNQSEIGNIKKKNSDHYSKLDKDRTNKNCDYAILVSTLEPDNEFFNRGIVQVREFKNMYVVRPNSLLILLSFITSFARKTLDEKREIIKLKNMNIDLANFEDNLANAKELMQVNTDRVTANFAKSIVEIDKIISQLEKHKSTLQKIDSNFQIANRKAQDITVKKLTYKNTFMQRVFQKIREEKKNAQ
tara:strand:+ start:184 stop:1518 length:1335 start_codon:yes stop_codon:yes gene_type:complete